MLNEGYSLRDFIYISLLATIATVSKTPIRLLSNLLTSSIGLPGGVIGGVYYMFWIVATCGIVNKRGTATLFCIVQAFVSICISNMSPVMVITYLPPGIAVDLFLLGWRKPQFNRETMIIQGVLANAAGAVTSAIIIMHLPPIAILVTLTIAMVSGAIGGYLAFAVVDRLKGVVPCN